MVTVHFNVDRAHYEVYGDHFQMDGDQCSPLGLDHWPPATLKQSMVEGFNLENNQRLWCGEGAEGGGVGLDYYNYMYHDHSKVADDHLFIYSWKLITRFFL